MIAMSRTLAEVNSGKTEEFDVGAEHVSTSRPRLWHVTVLVAFLSGCSEQPSAPPSITAGQRTAIRQHVSKLGGRVTSDESEALFLSLRNIHIQVRDAGGVIEVAGRSMQDLLDFGRASEAVATAFLADGEVANFRLWLQSALSPADPGAARAEYGNLQLNVSRAPLRLVFAPRSRLTSDR